LANLPKLKAKTTQKKKFVLQDLQPSYRDFAFFVDEAVEAGKVIDLVKRSNREIIKEVDIFDIYKG
jgi:phenylalanyl-tRNA synthetase beta chain